MSLICSIVFQQNETFLIGTFGVFTINWFTGFLLLFLVLDQGLTLIFKIWFSSNMHFTPFSSLRILSSNNILNLKLIVLFSNSSLFEPHDQGVLIVHRSSSSYLLVIILLKGVLIVRLIFRFILLKGIFWLLYYYFTSFLISNVVTAWPNGRNSF